MDEIVRKDSHIAKHSIARLAPVNVPLAAPASADETAKEAKRQCNACILGTLCPFLLNDSHASELTVWAGGALRLDIIHFVDRSFVLHALKRGLPSHWIFFLECLVDGHLNVLCRLSCRLLLLALLNFSHLIFPGVDASHLSLFLKEI